MCRSSGSRVLCFTSRVLPQGAVDIQCHLSHLIVFFGSIYKDHEHKAGIMSTTLPLRGMPSRACSGLSPISHGQTNRRVAWLRHPPDSQQSRCSVSMSTGFAEAASRNSRSLRRLSALRRAAQCHWKHPRQLTIVRSVCVPPSKAHGITTPWSPLYPTAKQYS